MSITSKSSLIKRTENKPNNPVVSELDINFYSLSPSEAILRDQIPDTLARFTFGIFESNNLSDVRNLVSQKENNAITIESTDDKLYVENLEPDPVDFLAHYLIQRG